jgi:hypothetical protein
MSTYLSKAGRLWKCDKELYGTGVTSWDRETILSEAGYSTFQEAECVHVAYVSHPVIRRLP